MVKKFVAKDNKKPVVKKPVENKKSAAFQNVKGMADILPKDQLWWRAFEKAGRNIAELYDFYSIETPILENAALFEEGVGELTDIVEKQMFTFKTRGDDRLTLRPENTAGVMRAYLQYQLGYFASPLKVSYYGPMFRYEKPQFGRGRQFHQWGLEVIGDSDPVYDVELILAALELFRELKINKDVQLKINTIGCRVCRTNYRQKLKDYYRSHKSKTCADCQRRYEKNVFRLLDCKNEECKAFKEKAPIILDYLCQNCNNHFKGVLEIIEDNSLVYEVNPHLVRGLDYYNRTVFEFSHSLGFEVGGGGRYDYLSERIGGRAVPAVGLAIGAERVIEAMKSKNIIPNFKVKPKLFMAAVGDQAKKASLKLMGQLRQNGLIVAEALGKKSLGLQLKAADKAKANLTFIFGQKELFEGTIIVRNMESGEQETIRADKIVEEAKRRL
ncbi:MAG: histidine--tRNA ligase [bacterium]|nr:histidine--tRNA ligase [bacterium]